ncbi:hypothetical protein NOI87_32215, partial [Neorhizobium galegae]|nr:hypothetical protein [Neorhizobium galegae]
MEWTISIEGTNELGDRCRRKVRIDKGGERVRDGDLGLSIDDGKKIMVAPAERSRERGGGGLRPALTGLSGLPRLSASQGT